MRIVLFDRSKTRKVVEGFRQKVGTEQRQPAHQFDGLDRAAEQWRFASAENRDLFLANPDAYSPQYGGYCAWAAAQGYTAPGNPKNWSVVDGKLYLNYNDKVQRDWEQDIPGFIAKADANWPAVLDK